MKNYREKTRATALERRVKMLALLAEGWTMAAIGRRYRISRQRVHAIVAKGEKTE